jgi:two-component system, chemotaxis family, chemotaxis protein CheY
MPDAAATVLVVDDDFDVRDTLADVFEQEGLAAAFAADGLEALEYLRNNPRPGLILLDWMMPRCNGPAFREAQLGDATISDIPVVLMTADTHGENKRELLGVSGLLQKPVALSDLLAVVRKHCA